MDFLIHHILRTSASHYPDKEALVSGDKRLSYSEAAQSTFGLALGLRNAGLRRGDRVGILLEASVEQALSIYAVSEAEGVFVPINSQLFPEQISHIARDCGMTALIVSAAKLAGLAEHLADLPSLKFLVTVGTAEVPGLDIPRFVFEEWRTQAGDKYWVERAIGKDLAAILYTSGSTGKPKGVMLSHANIIAGSSIVSKYLSITSDERILAVLPFSFDAGLNQVMTSVQQGATVVIMKFAFARDIVRMLVKERITGLAGVPTLWGLLAQDNSGLQKQPLYLRYITNTGGAMPESLLAILRMRLPGTKVFLMYGLTEAFRSTYLPPEEIDRRPTSIGKAIPDTEILVLDEADRPCGPGEIGELVHRGPTVSLGYWGRPEDTNRVLRPNPLLPRELGDCERVCYSGDLVRCDEDGFLYYVGRRDALIKTSGYRVSPTEVEDVLYQTKHLRQVAVIGIPDAILGQAIKAFVVFHENRPQEVEELMTYCGERLPAFMVPKTIEVLTDLPRTSSGKVDYPALRQHAAV